MNCHNIEQLLDEYIDATLDPVQRSLFIAHASQCEACRHMVVSAQALQQSLKVLPAPRPRDGFFDAALAKAAASHRHRYWQRALGGAIAAGLGLVLAINLWLMPPAELSHQTTGEIPNVQIALQQTRNVNLVFTADHALQEARLTLLLPPNMALSGYDGQRRVSWTTQLKKGKNLLVLPITAQQTGKGILTAELEQQGKKETFTINLESETPLHESSRTDKPLITA